MRLATKKHWQMACSRHKNTANHNPTGPMMLYRGDLLLRPEALQYPYPCLSV